MNTQAVADGSGRSDPYKVNSLLLGPKVDPVAGVVRWDPIRSIWNGSMLAAALILGPLYASWGAFAVFLALSAVTLCGGHSVGFHRRLVHRSFKCAKWVERVLVWTGAMVGMGGPIWTIRTHDTRDWAQRQPRCHDYLAHRHGLLKDGWWNLHCRLVLDNPPGFDPGPGIANDGFYRFLEQSWKFHQIPLALCLYALGGWSWVVWGVFVRVAACTTMHWFISYFAHTRGPQSWLVDGAGVQAHDVPIAAIPTMGESWHNNHHAFPASARHGLYPGQADPGYRFIQVLEFLGLAWDVQTPGSLPPRPGITALRPNAAEVLGHSCDTHG
jgi:stearoyl-CoA desaturase (delta-9 desaturase)